MNKKTKRVLLDQTYAGLSIKFGLRFISHASHGNQKLQWFKIETKIGNKRACLCQNRIKAKLQ